MIEIEYIPTQEQEVAMLKAQNALMVNALSFAASTFSDEQAVKVVELYPEWSSNSINYKVGERIRDEEFNLYKVIKEHVSQESLKPSVSSSLFSKLSIACPLHRTGKRNAIINTNCLILLFIFISLIFSYCFKVIPPPLNSLFVSRSFFANSSK